MSKNAHHIPHVPNQHEDVPAKAYVWHMYFKVTWLFLSVFREPYLEFVTVGSVMQMTGPCFPGLPELMNTLATLLHKPCISVSLL